MEHVKSKVTSSNSEIPLLVDKLLGGGYSPLLQHRTTNGGVKHPSHIPPTQSPDSAIHSCCSPAQSPITSRHNPPSSSGFSSPSTFTPSSLSRNNSDASQYGGSQHSSCYSQRLIIMYNMLYCVVRRRNVLQPWNKFKNIGKIRRLGEIVWTFSLGVVQIIRVCLPQILPSYSCAELYRDPVL